MLFRSIVLSTKEVWVVVEKSRESVFLGASLMAPSDPVHMGRDSASLGRSVIALSGCVRKRRTSAWNTVVSKRIRSSLRA